MRLKISKPIVFFDLEATGINVLRDRIVEICVVRIQPDSKRDIKKRLVNPGIPIPEEASAIHGITDDDVKDAPSFMQLSRSFYNFLENCDLGGFNLLKFDIPMLCEEFKRSGLSFSMNDRKVIDVQRIYHKKEPRTLAAALKFYCNREHIDAHGSEADTIATIDVLEKQLEIYEDIPRTVGELDEFCNPPNPSFVDKAGKLRWNNDEVVIGFGQKMGRSLKDLADNDTGYLKWILRGDFDEEVKDIVKDALIGRFPQKN